MAAGDDRYAIEYAQVRGHAKALDAAADRVAAARGAAAQARLGSEAYGQLCGFLPGAINPIADQAVTATGLTSDVLHENAALLRGHTTDAQSAALAIGRQVARIGDRTTPP